MGKPLKILFLMEDLCFGGTQRQTLELASRLDRGLFAPSMLTLTGPTDLDNLALEKDLPVSNMALGRKPRPLFFWQLRERLRQESPDILVPCTALPNIWGRIWGRLLKIPVVVGTCRGGGAPKRQHEKFLWRRASAIVCNSRALVEHMRGLGVPAEQLHYIPNGVDTAHFRPGTPATPPLILCVARLARDKDLPTLLGAFRRVGERDHAARLRLVGDGPEGVSLRALADNILPPGIRERVEFAGAASDPLPHYNDAVIFALSSEREGQPNVILEAMSCGLPVCATAVGGIPDLVRPGVNGLLCAPHDEEALAANILELLGDRERGARMGAEGRRQVEDNFSFGAMTAAHQELFLRLWRQTRML